MKDLKVHLQPWYQYEWSSGSLTYQPFISIRNHIDLTSFQPVLCSPGLACCWIRSVFHGITGLYWNTSWGIGRWAHKYTWYAPNWKYLVFCCFPLISRDFSRTSGAILLGKCKASIMEMWPVLQQCQNLTVRGRFRLWVPSKAHTWMHSKANPGCLRSSDNKEEKTLFS